MTAEGAFTVRRATAADAAVVGRLLFDFNAEFETPTPSAEQFAARFETLLRRDDVLVFLAEADEATGFALVTLRPTPYGDGPLAQLEELYVRPWLRGRGTGSALLSAALDASRERAAIEMHINVDEVDADARRFYERHGFSNVAPDIDSRMLFYIRGL